MQRHAQDGRAAQLGTARSLLYSASFSRSPVRLAHACTPVSLQEPAASMQYLLLVLKAIAAEVKREDTVYVVDWDGTDVCFTIREEQVRQG